MLTMSLLSKSEIQYLQVQKQVSGSHGCKARTIFPWVHEIDTTLFPDFGLTNRKTPSVSRCVPLEQKGYKTCFPRNRRNGNDLYEQ